MRRIKNLQRRVVVMIVEDLIEQALAETRAHCIKDIRIGLGYTGVVLDDDSCGLAYTFRNGLGGHCGVLREAGSIIGMDVEDLLSWSLDSNLIKAAIGLACINATLNNRLLPVSDGNVVEAIDVKPHETFGMVGEFAPILSNVKKLTENIYVFEKNVRAGSDLYAESDIPEYLPTCDVVVLTATSIINHTLDEVLSSCKNARKVCIVGPSTPLCAEVFQQHNVTLLAGSVVKDTAKVLQVISQGGGTLAMKRFCSQVMLNV
jgi:uncharacterized protein